MATHSEAAISIDGLPDEPAWKDAEVIDQFIQREPAEGSPATRKTEVRILFGTDNLYVSAIMYDSPDAVENTLGRRDELNRADWFLISFDSYFNRRTAYTFAVNAAGVQLDGRQGRVSTNTPTGISEIEGLDTSWDAIWFSSVRITDEGWTAELRIPYSMLRFPGYGGTNLGASHFPAHSTSGRSYRVALHTQYRAGQPGCPVWPDSRNKKPETAT
jgi:hypothetical protein